MDEERSAGGVVFRGERVLVLCNYRGEHLFPKGHLEPGESQLQAAVREVEEEAGLKPQVISFVQDTSYSYCLPDGIARQKRVSWYLMESEAEDMVVDGVEIIFGSFLSVEDAMVRLTHDLDRQLLQKTVEVRQRERYRG